MNTKLNQSNCDWFSLKYEEHKLNEGKKRKKVHLYYAKGFFRLEFVDVSICASSDVPSTDW